MTNLQHKSFTSIPNYRFVHIKFNSFPKYFPHYTFKNFKILNDSHFMYNTETFIAGLHSTSLKEVFVIINT